MHQVLFKALVNQSSQLRCISTRLSFGGSKTIAYINHQPHNKPCGLQHQLVPKNMLLRKEVI
ncbi:hypothetical protein, partial [Corynebacterium sp. HMSC034H07]|uniref:hypothetical protein n=1 Tax=Corynebacterium sp. HMSC034H07 TaxID=1739512 RepID=UPI001E3277AE